MQESRTIICKDCKLPQVAFLDGKFGDDKTKRWVDNEGRLFNGLLCPGCQVKRVGERLKNNRKGVYS